MKKCIVCEKPLKPIQQKICSNECWVVFEKEYSIGKQINRRIKEVLQQERELIEMYRANLVDKESLGFCMYEISKIREQNQRAYKILRNVKKISKKFGKKFSTT
jgi:predicted nucleic acid-binding Zn ribbon protein